MKPYYIDSLTRIKRGWYFTDPTIKLQRRCWYGWKTTAWNYETLFNDKSAKEIITWLLWSEERKANEKKVVDSMNKFHNFQ